MAKILDPTTVAESVGASYPEAFKEPLNLAEIEALQQWLVEQPEIGGTTSLVDYLKLLNRGFL